MSPGQWGKAAVLGVLIGTALSVFYKPMRYYLLRFLERRVDQPYVRQRAASVAVTNHITRLQDPTHA